MAAETDVTTKPRFSYPYKGLADISWPTCPNCGGYGVITQELAIAGAKGTKGDPCAMCNGAGRVPDPAWPACACPEVTAACVVCGGLGKLSPHVQAALGDRVTAAQAAADEAVAHLSALTQAGKPISTSAPLPARA